MDLVLIEWVDSTQPTPDWAWIDEVSWKEVALCRSVGWLVYDGEEVKALAPNVATVCGDVQISGVIRIPTRAVVRITRLREGDATSSDAPSGESAQAGRSRREAYAASARGPTPR